MGRNLNITRDPDTGNPIAWPIDGRPDWSEPVVLLIHGYNVEAQPAAKSFDSLFTSIRLFARLPPLLDFRSWRVFWQGYTSSGLAGGRIPVLSEIMYASEISSAIAVAKALYDYIDREAHGRAEIMIVAHSLGCRAALELLEMCATRGPSGIRFPLVVLMAAAVPTFFFEDMQHLARGVLLAENVVVLFSADDAVLTKAFRFGQTILGEGFFPYAVGATGMPETFWKTAIPTRNSHSGYFKDELTARVIAREFGQAAVIPSRVRQRPQAPPAARALAELPLPVRNV